MTLMLRSRFAPPAMLRRTCSLCLGLVALAAVSAAAAEDPFAANVRPTDPLTPSEQREAFEVPAGFEVQLVAAEPDINKPMNLAFDSIGRLWVTTSREYPRPAPPDRSPRDRLMIFEDFGPDGRARKVTTFADNLNIPIGVYPFRSPSSKPDADGRIRYTWKAIVWSIPNIWLMEDTDGDGKADERRVLYGPFDYTRDTHGNQASFRRGFDGWLYATHGYNNDSHVAGRDGHKVHLNSGNTYRVRLDGSRIEHHTWGQVNPFGLAWDPEGNLYSSDCHSDPIYLLQEGGYYPSFGKPHDGLGFAPNTMEQIRGSTAIDGISYYADDLWPEEYRDNVFIGDVMTSRVYRDLAAPRGSGKVTRARPDFVVSRDPWFRPVDTTLGPDGALYIADFYNRIIGHYEVPLEHPGRDRERGRIWRVVYKESPLRPAAIATDREGLIAELASPSLPRRMLAMNELADVVGASAIPDLRRVVKEPENAFQHIHALWLLNRFDALEDNTLVVAARHEDPLRRIHAMRIIAERARRDSIRTPGDLVRHGFSATLEEAALAGLRDSDPRVQRNAVSVLAVRRDYRFLKPLLELRMRVSANDPHLLYGVRQAIRNVLAAQPNFTRVLDSMWNEGHRRAMADVAVAVHSSAAARFLLENFDLFAADAEFSNTALTHIARNASEAELDSLAATLQSRNVALDLQLDIFRSIQQGIAQRGGAISETVRQWGQRLAERLLDSVASAGTWTHRPFDAASAGVNPWAFQVRPCTDNVQAELLSSHPLGEQHTSRLESPRFRAPARLAFYLAGHDGHPSAPAAGKNAVHLCDAATGEILEKAAPPRNDIAHRIEWDLSSLEGREVFLEVVDGNTATAWAWLAIGRIEPDVISLPQLAPAQAIARQIAAAEIVGTCKAETLLPRIRRMVEDSCLDLGVRAAAARALVTDPHERAVADLVANPFQPWEWRSRLADILLKRDKGGDEFLASVWREAPRRFQVALASTALVRPDYAEEWLLSKIGDGRIPVGLLQDRGLRERLRRVVSDDGKRLIEKLTAGLPAEDVELQRLIDGRRAAYAESGGDPVRGREVFVNACAACHQIGSLGSVVGPQLTGIGTRGLERLCEDILAPNRNVDHAFWTTELTLKDGDVITGLFRREEGEVLVLANVAGTEITVPKREVVSRQESSQSVMPSNFGDALSAEDFNHLLAFLLDNRGTE